MESNEHGRIGLGLLLALAVMLAVMGLAEAFGKTPDRVAAARRTKQAEIASLFKSAGVSYPPGQTLIRVFKLEGELELWARDPARENFQLLKTFPICYVPGRLGPKRRQGDNQVPEGVYQINVWNPYSAYHLSLGLNYPNQSDRLLGQRGNLGADIFIHGECVSIGCVPIQNDPIEIVYLVTADSQQKYRQPQVAHLFPCRMDTSACQGKMSKAEADRPELKIFWQDLEKIYRVFAKEHKLPRVIVDGQGRYQVK